MANSRATKPGWESPSWVPAELKLLSLTSNLSSSKMLLALMSLINSGRMHLVSVRFEQFEQYIVVKKIFSASTYSLHFDRLAWHFIHSRGIDARTQESIPLITLQDYQAWKEFDLLTSTYINIFMRELLINFFWFHFSLVFAKMYKPSITKAIILKFIFSITKWQIYRNFNNSECSTCH